MRVDRDAVAGLIREVADAELLARFRAPQANPFWEKAGGELVSQADLETERRLTERLPGLLAGSVVLGEESVAADPARLGVLATATGPVWVVDPLDGTARFARGEPDFSTMVALVERGRTIAAWIYAPALGLAADAVLGEGCRLPAGRARKPGRRVLVTDPAFQTPDDRRQIALLAAAGWQVQPCRSVGTGYLELAAGEHDAAVFGWTKVWDHAPGALLYQESGGVSVDGTGCPFQPDGAAVAPLVFAADPATAGQLHRIVSG